MDNASPILGQKDLITSVGIFEEIKNPLGENLAVSTLKEGTRGLIQAGSHSSGLV